MKSGSIAFIFSIDSLLLILSGSYVFSPNSRLFSLIGVYCTFLPLPLGLSFWVITNSILYPFSYKFSKVGTANSGVPIKIIFIYLLLIFYINRIYKFNYLIYLKDSI